MGRNETQNQQSRERARAAILDAALALFGEQGLERTTTAQVAQRAGVSKGLIYHYFPSKQALIGQVLERHGTRMHTATRDLAKEGLHPRDELRAIAHAMVEAVEGDPDGYRMMLRALASPDVQHAVAVSMGGPRREILEERLRALGCADPALEARFLQTGLLGILVHRTLSPFPTETAPLVDRLVDAILERKSP